MKQPTTKQIAAQIKRNNAKFKKASPAQKRVMIAKDVIARIMSRQYTPTCGVWVDGGIYGVADSDRDAPMQPIIVGGQSCEVCALGGAFVSCTALNNRQSGGDFCAERYRLGEQIVEGEKFSNGFTAIFEPEQLCLIETAFEEGSGFGDWGSVDCPESEVDEAVAFGKGFRSSRSRLLAIMRNIVKNKGTFKP